MRVITPLGFGTAVGGETRDAPDTPVEVTLDQQFAGTSPHTLERGEVFPWSDFATVHVLNVKGVGWISNIRLHPTSEDALRRFEAPAPPNETIFFLDLATGEGRVNRELGILAKNFLWINPWLDRWALERPECFKKLDFALKSFAGQRVQMAGGTGISCAILLDVRRNRTANPLWFYLIAETLDGPLFEKKFIEHRLA